MKIAPRRLRVQLLIPSIALIIATTMIPDGFRHPSLAFIEHAYNWGDFIDNLILYLPLGFALGSTSILRALSAGLALSFSAECLQLAYIERTPSVFDAATNTFGVLLGYLFAGLVALVFARRPKTIAIPKLAGLVALPLAVLGLLAMVRNRTASDFSNWDPTYHLAVGNELNGGRAWSGTISKLAIYSSAMSADQIRALSSQPLGAGAIQPDTPLFESASPISIANGDAKPLLSKAGELAFYQALVRESKLTLLVWMNSGNLKQAGPARIVTYSADSLNRNFTLGQVRNTLTFRLRTPATGTNGTEPALYSAPVLSPGRTALVAAVYDGLLSTLYVDGTRVAHANLGAQRPRLPRHVIRLLPRILPIRSLELIVSEIFLSGLFVLGVFSLIGARRSRLKQLVIGLACGATVGAAFWVLGVSEPVLGIRILCECIFAALAVAVSTEEPATTLASASTTY